MKTFKNWAGVFGHCCTLLVRVLRIGFAEALTGFGESLIDLGSVLIELSGRCLPKDRKQGRLF